jgi:hypothetical protein
MPVQAPRAGHRLLWRVHGAEQECSAGGACAAVPYLGPLDPRRAAQPAAVPEAVQECGAVEG